MRRGVGGRGSRGAEPTRRGSGKGPRFDQRSRRGLFGGACWQACVLVHGDRAFDHVFDRLFDHLFDQDGQMSCLPSLVWRRGPAGVRAGQLGPRLRPVHPPVPAKASGLSACQGGQILVKWWSNGGQSRGGEIPHSLRTRAESCGQNRSNGGQISVELQQTAGSTRGQIAVKTAVELLLFPA